jgi:hypothetical protein
VSSNLQKPTLNKPGSTGVPVKPMTAPKPAPAQVARPVAPVSEPDPFESEVPTSGVPLQQGFEMGLKGSEFFGKQPAAMSAGGFDDDFGDPPAEGIGEPAGEEAEAEEDDWGDDDGTGSEEVEAVEEDDPFADTPDEDPEVTGSQGPTSATYAAPPVRPRPVGVPTPAKTATPVTAKAPAGRKAFQLLQANGSLVFDTKLMMNLVTVSDAKAVWDTLFKPWEDMNDAERYTRNAAGEILLRDRDERMKAARLLAQALATDEEPEFEGETVDVVMTLGKEEAQADSADLGLTDPKNAMMAKCHNRSVGCNAMRLNHLQSTGRCFYPDCPCKGKCQSFVEKTAGGEAAQEGTKSVVGQPAQPIAPRTVVGTPPQPAIQRAGAVPAGGNPATTRPNPTTAASQGQRPQAQGTGSKAQGRGSSGQLQNPGNSQQARTQVGQSTANSAAAVGVQKPQQTQARPAQASNQAGVTRPTTGGKQPSVERANTQTKREGQAGSEEEPLITGDLLGHIVAHGGRGPEHSDYWPTDANPDTSEMGLQRREYIINRFVRFYSNAITTEQDLGTGKQRMLNTKDFNLKSNSYRVVLAANRVNEAIQMYVAAPQETGYQEEPRSGKDNLSPTDNDIVKNVVGPAAIAYIDAHKVLAPDEIDCSWDEYLQYLEVFKKNGLEYGMLVHEFQKSQQTQQ